MIRGSSQKYTQPFSTSSGRINIITPINREEKIMYSEEATPIKLAWVDL